MRFQSKFFLLCLFFVLGCAGLDQDSQNGNVAWLSFEELANSLQGRPSMNVGFDVDDTVLFSSPAFYYGMNKYSPGAIDFLNKQAFWEELNNQLDQFSLPKDIAGRLIDLHKQRGDTIHFITARPATTTENLTGLLNKTFGLENTHKVIFTGYKRGENFKIAPIKRLNIRIFYGDSDTDIEAAQANGIRAIRIMRAGNTTYKPLPDYGALGEEVLLDSQF